MLKMTMIFLIFLCGLYFCLNYEQAVLYEAFDSMDNGDISKPSCPNILIKSGNELLLKNTKLAEIPGVNPLRFKNLEEYVEFTEWQRSQGIKCPVLFLQNSYDAQGKNVFKIRPNPNELRGGLPPNLTESVEDVSTQKIGPLANQMPEKSLLIDASRDDPPYNKKQYPGFDPDNQYVGIDVPLDKMYNTGQYKPVSDNAMDSNWGGAQYSERVVDSGHYDENKR
jgi:hypothetical protein